MNSRMLTCITVMTLLAGLATPARLAAQDQVEQNKKQSDFVVIGLGTLGGTMTTANRVNDEGWVAGSANLAHTLPSTITTTLSAPHSLTASARDTFQVSVSWQEASGQSLSGFDIYRCIGCATPRSEGTKIASVGATVLTFTDGSSARPLQEHTAYSYQVTGFNSSIQSAPSNTASAITKTEPAPTNLTSSAFAHGFGELVELSWTNNATDDDRYFVESCTGSKTSATATCTNFSVVAQLPANSTRYSQVFPWRFGLHNVPVRYRVRAHSPGGYSGYSNIRTQRLL